MVDVLVFGETRGEDLDSTTRELLGAAQDLGGEVGVTLMGRSPSGCAAPPSRLAPTAYTT